MRETLTAVIVLLMTTFLAVGCEKVSQGGVCHHDSDCDDTSTACVIAPGKEAGFCSRACDPDKAAGESSDCMKGLSCVHHDEANFTLGANYCEKKAGK